MRIGTFLEKSIFFSYLTPNFLLFLVSIKSARSKLQISNFFRKILKKKVRVELWNFVETIFRATFLESPFFAWYKNVSKDEKTSRADYSGMVRRREKRSFALNPQRPNLNFKKIFWLFANQWPKNRLFLKNSWVTASNQLINGSKDAELNTDSKNI